MAKFNVGDKVRVKDSCEGHKDIGFTNAMRKYCGTIVTIKRVFNKTRFNLSDVTYHIEEYDNGTEFFWAEDWLEPIDSATN